VNCSSKVSEEIKVPEIDEQQIELIEEYQIRSFNHGMFIRLYSDSSFANEVYNWGCLGGGSQKIVIGHYSQILNQLSFRPIKTVFNEYSEADEFISDTLKYSYTDSTKIQFDYYKINLEGVNMLISNEKLDEHNETFFRPSNLITLANEFNSGWETRMKREILASKDTTILIGRSKILEVIPHNWNDYFLAQPINCKVLSIDKYEGVSTNGQSQTTAYKIDVGKIGGIKIGMKLYPNNSDCEELEVFEVNEQFSKARGSYPYGGVNSCNRVTTLSTIRNTTN